MIHIVAQYKAISFYHLQTRLAWTQHKLHLRLRDMRRVHWSDEFVFQLGKNSGLVRVWRRRGERYLNECVVPSFAFGRVSVMVWGCVSFDCKMDLIDIRGNLNGRRYVDEILEPHVEPHMDNHALNDRPIFMQDGATPHTVRISQHFLHDAAIDVMSCCGQAKAQIWTSSKTCSHTLVAQSMPSKSDPGMLRNWETLSTTSCRHWAKRTSRDWCAAFIVESGLSYGGHIPYWVPCCWSVSLVTSPRIKHVFISLCCRFLMRLIKMLFYFIIFNVFHYIKFPKIWFMQNNVVQSKNNTFI